MTGWCRLLRAFNGGDSKALEAGDAVLADFFVEGEGSSSGVRVRMHVYLVFTFRAGQVARRRLFQKLDDARAAVP